MGRTNYRKLYFSELSKHFKDADWSRFNGAMGIEEKWDMLLEIYNGTVRRHIPKMCSRDKEGKK